MIGEGRMIDDFITLLKGYSESKYIGKRKIKHKEISKTIANEHTTELTENATFQQLTNYIEAVNYTPP